MKLVITFILLAAALWVVAPKGDVAVVDDGIVLINNDGGRPDVCRLLSGRLPPKGVYDRSVLDGTVLECR